MVEFPLILENFISTERLLNFGQSSQQHFLLRVCRYYLHGQILYEGVTNDNMKGLSFPRLIHRLPYKLEVGFGNLLQKSETFFFPDNTTSEYRNPSHLSSHPEPGLQSTPIPDHG